MNREIVNKLIRTLSLLEWGEYYIEKDYIFLKTLLFYNLTFNWIDVRRGSGCRITQLNRGVLCMVWAVSKLTIRSLA